MKILDQHQTPECRFPAAGECDLDKSTHDDYTETLKRKVRLVAEEPSRLNGKARLHAYGARAVASVAGVSVKTVRRDAISGRIDLASLESVRRWITERKAVLP